MHLIILKRVSVLVQKERCLLSSNSLVFLFFCTVKAYKKQNTRKCSHLVQCNERRHYNYSLYLEEFWFPAFFRISFFFLVQFLRSMENGKQLLVR